MTRNTRYVPIFIALLMIQCACDRGRTLGSAGAGAGSGFDPSFNGGNGTPGAGDLGLGGAGGSSGSNGDYGSAALRTAAPSILGPDGINPLSLSDLFGDPGLIADLPPTVSVGVEYAMQATSTGSGVSCAGLASPGPGWKLTREQPILTSGSTTVSVVCLYVRLRSDGFKGDYTVTHAGGGAGAGVYCGTQPPAGGDWRLKGGGCVRQNSGCISDVCLWERTSSTLNVLGLTHAGGNTTDNVDCRSGKPIEAQGLNFEKVDRAPLLSNGSNVWSDLCLWQYGLQL